MKGIGIALIAWGGYNANSFYQERIDTPAKRISEALPKFDINGMIYVYGPIVLGAYLVFLRK